MAERMAQMQAMLNSMTPEQRAQLQGLAEQLLEDMDLDFLASQLGQNLQQMFPQLDWNKQYDFQGDNPMGFAEAAQMMAELGDLDQLENLLQSATQPGALAEADLDRARELLGDDAARVARAAVEAGQAARGRRPHPEQGGPARAHAPRPAQDRQQRPRRPVLEAGQGQARPPRHVVDRHRSRAHVRHQGLRVGRPVQPPHRARRSATPCVARRAGTPVRLTPDDFEIERTETIVRSATVLMLDLSLSMPMRDNFLPAKKVAMALHALISGQFPQDYLGLVGFSKVAHVLTPEQLPEVSWDYDYGTNMQHGFQLARQLLWPSSRAPSRSS